MRYDEIVAQGLSIFEKANIDKRWLDLGAETQSQNRLNRLYIDSLSIETRILGSELADTNTTLFGVKLRSPIMPAAIISSRVLEKLAKSDILLARTSYSFSTDYMEEFVNGVADAGSIMWWGANSPNESIVRAIENGSKVVLIIKPLKNKDRVLEVVKWAEKVGCVAVGMDIDSMFLEKANDEYEGPKHHGPQSVADLTRYRKATSLPFVIKGVLSVQDAKIAVEKIHADAIVVSNHGGEVIDYSVPILQVLPDIRSAIGKMPTIIVDSGLRRGSDVFKALALGANGACFGNLLVLAYVAYGRYGVSNMLEILGGELRRIMSYTGSKTIEKIDPSVIHRSSY
jgi:4-hydroxymandelate oxidase